MIKHKKKVYLIEKTAKLWDIRPQFCRFSYLYIMFKR